MSALRSHRRVRKEEFGNRLLANLFEVRTHSRWSLSVVGVVQMIACFVALAYPGAWIIQSVAAVFWVKAYLCYKSDKTENVRTIEQKYKNLLKKADDRIAELEKEFEDKIQERRKIGNFDLYAMTMENGGKPHMTNEWYKQEMQEVWEQYNGADRERRLIQKNNKRNSFLDDDVIDLHGLSCDMAIKVLNRRLNEIDSGKRPKILYVVTGRGHGSTEGYSVIKQMIIESTRSRAVGIECAQMYGNDGVLILTVKKIKK